MSTFVSRGLYLVLFTGGLTLLGAGVANAADTTGDDGVLSGTQIVAPLSVPVEVSGNAVSVLGDSLAGGASVPAAPAVPVPAPVPAPAATPAPAPVPAPAPTPPAPVSTSGSGSVAGGTQVVPVVAVPVSIGGNAVSVLGDSSSSGSAAAPASTTGSAGGASTSGNDSVAGGTQVVPVVAVPVNVGGNAVSVLGDAESGGSVTTPVREGTSGIVTSGDNGALGGTQIVPSVTLPITIGGNGITVVGDSTTTPAEDESATPAAPPVATPVTRPVAGDPATPATPATPVTVTSVGAVALPRTADAASVTAASVRSASSGPSLAPSGTAMLASTGVQLAVPMALMLFLLVAGFALAVLGRRRRV